MGKPVESPVAQPTAGPGEAPSDSHIDGLDARANASLRESEERFRAMADHAPVMVWVTEADGTCTFLSKSWYAFTGQTPETGLGFGWLAALHPDDVADAERAFADATASQTSFELEYRFRRTDGVYRWAIDSAAPRRGADGAFLGFIGSVFDIDDRRQTEEALRASEARYRTLFDSMDEGFCILDVLSDADGQPADWRFVEINPAFEAQTGLSDAAGRRMRELIPDHDDHWFETYGRVARTGEPVRFVSESQSMNQWFDLFAFPVDSPGGNRVAVLFSNITAQKRSEAEVQALNATLEARVAERTRQTRQLAARLTVAEQDERQRIAHVLHDDIQQRLFGLSMVLALVRRAPDLDAVAGLADRATEILDGAVQVARSLATELSPSILQANRVADLLAWTAAEARSKHGLDVAVEVAGDPQVADPALRILLYQSLREVLFNVVKHAGVPAARLVAWVEPDVDGGALAVVRVEDDGAGFDDAAAALDQPGGFGLFSVRERLQVVGGRFEVASNPGTGTRVTLAVPSGEPTPDSP